MFVVIPWKGGRHPIRDHQVNSIEHDDRGPFLRVRNAATGNLNKCRVVAGGVTSPSNKTASALPPRSLSDLIGSYVNGTIVRTGSDYVALIVTSISGFQGSQDDLVVLAQSYLKMQGSKWKVSTPNSWSIKVPAHQTLGPHVSLHETHMKDIGKNVTLRIKNVMHWEEASRWVALFLEGPLIDKTDWELHMSCAQGSWK